MHACTLYIHICMNAGTLHIHICMHACLVHLNVDIFLVREGASTGNESADCSTANLTLCPVDILDTPTLVVVPG